MKINKRAYMADLSPETRNLFRKHRAKIVKFVAPGDVLESVVLSFETPTKAFLAYRDFEKLDGNGWVCIGVAPSNRSKSFSI